MVAIVAVIVIVITELPAKNTIVSKRYRPYLYKARRVCRTVGPKEEKNMRKGTVCTEFRVSLVC